MEYTFSLVFSLVLDQQFHQWLYISHEVSTQFLLSFTFKLIFLAYYTLRQSQVTADKYSKNIKEQLKGILNFI